MLCDSLNYCIDKKGLEIFCYVLMSTNMHITARAKNYNLSDFVRDFKKFTSGKLINEIRFGNDEKKDSVLNSFSTGGKKQKNKSNNQLWQYNNHAEEVYSPQFTLPAATDLSTICRYFSYLKAYKFCHASTDDSDRNRNHRSWVNG